MIDKDTIIYIVVTVCVWSLVAAVGYFVIIPAMLTATQHPEMTNESLPEMIMKIAIIVIPATVIWYFIMKWGCIRSRV